MKRLRFREAKLPKMHFQTEMNTFKLKFFTFCFWAICPKVVLFLFLGRMYSNQMAGKNTESYKCTNGQTKHLKVSSWGQKTEFWSHLLLALWLFRWFNLSEPQCHPLYNETILPSLNGCCGAETRQWIRKQFADCKAPRMSLSCLLQRFMCFFLWSGILTYIHITRINVIFVSLQQYPCGVICGGGRNLLIIQSVIFTTPSKQGFSSMTICSPRLISINTIPQLFGVWNGCNKDGGVYRHTASLSRIPDNLF